MKMAKCEPFTNKTRLNASENNPPYFCSPSDHQSLSANGFLLVAGETLARHGRSVEFLTLDKKRGTKEVMKSPVRCATASWLLFGAVQVSDIKHIKTAVSLIDNNNNKNMSKLLQQTTRSPLMEDRRRSTGKVLDKVSWGDVGLHHKHAQLNLLIFSGSGKALRGLLCYILNLFTEDVLLLKQH